MNKIKCSKYPIFIAVTCLIVCCSCQSNPKQLSNDKLSKELSDSLNSGNELLDGLHFTPNNSINRQELSRQFQLNKSWWTEAFNYVKTQDLKTVAPGTYIDSNNVIAIVWEGNPKIKDSVLWEAHKDFNDLQYIISGEVEMGIAPLDEPNKNVIAPYS